MNIDNPKVSIVVPTFNRANFLEECLKSIINQDYLNLEVIVSDDNSSDNTYEVVKRFQIKYPFIKYVKNDKYPQGPNGNKNNGLDYCRGEIIGIFDDDDIMPKNTLKFMVDKLLEGYDVVMGNCEIISNKNNNGTFSGFGMEQDGEIDWKDFFCGKISGEHWGIFRANILGNKRFDTDLYGGEGTLWRGMLKHKKIYYFHKVVRYYRMNNNSVSHNMIKQADKAIRNYERDIEYYGKDLEKYCPCHLATIYKGAAYFAKLSSQYKKAFTYISKSINICPNYFSAYIIFIIIFLPKKIIPYLFNFKEYMKIIILNIKKKGKK